METLMQADIFFFITSISVVLLTILLIIIFIYLLQILKNFRDISLIFKNGADHASKNLEDLLKNIKKNPIFKYFFNKKDINKKKK